MSYTFIYLVFENESKKEKVIKYFKCDSFNYKYCVANIGELILTLKEELKKKELTYNIIEGIMQCKLRSTCSFTINNTNRSFIKKYETLKKYFNSKDATNTIYLKINNCGIMDYFFYINRDINNILYKIKERNKPLNAEEYINILKNHSLEGSVREERFIESLNIFQRINFISKLPTMKEYTKNLK